MTQKKTAKLIEFPRNRRARRDRHRVGGELADLRAEALKQRFKDVDPAKAIPRRFSGLKRR